MLTACDRFDDLAHLYDREDVLVQTWRGELATRLRARICPVNSYAAQNMPSCTGRSCDGRAGVREKAHHLHCCRPSLVRKPWPPVLDRGCWRALAPFERHRTSSICPSPGSAAAAGHRIGLSPLFPRAVSAVRRAWPAKYVAEKEIQLKRQEEALDAAHQELASLHEKGGTPKIKIDLLALQEDNKAIERELSKERKENTNKLKEKDETITFLMNELVNLKQRESMPPAAMLTN